MLKERPKIYFVATVETAVNAFLLNHLQKLSDHYDLTVIVNTVNPNFLSKQGLHVKVIPFNISRRINLYRDFQCLIHLIYIFLKNRPSAVHSITPKAGLLAMLAAKICRVSLRIHSFTGQVWVLKTGLERNFLRLIDKSLGSLTSHNFIDSPSQRNFLIKERVLTINKSFVFEQGSIAGVDLLKFKSNKQLGSSVRKEMQIPSEALVCLYLGRLVKDKGVLDLANAFSQINNTNAFLVFVGADEENLSVNIASICANKIKNIRFVGFTEEPSKYLASANILCLPSYREGFGNVIIEAAAMGVPAIASNIYGITDAIENNETGLLHSVGNVLDIKNTLEHLLSNPLLLNQFARAAQKRAVDKFDSRLITEAWLKFYRQHLN